MWKSFVFVVAACAGCLCASVALATKEVPPKVVEEDDGLYVWSLSESGDYAAISLTPDFFALDAIAWGIECPIDAMSDHRMCKFLFENPVTRKRNGSGLFVNYLGTSDPQFICVSLHDYPGKKAMIRVDKNAPFTTMENGCIAAAEVLPQLLTGTKVTLRRYTFPGNFSRDEEHLLTGFTKTIDTVRRIQEGTLTPAR
ncbi:hypothetical protein [Paracoccus denitrificans]|uniref:hypothetical protein n=1 Tax=Paracoccus denitrificans TaxID=266 RepID=UPI003364F52F